MKKLVIHKHRHQRRKINFDLQLSSPRLRWQVSLLLIVIAAGLTVGWISLQYSQTPIGSLRYSPQATPPVATGGEEGTTSEDQPAEFRMCLTGDNMLGTFVHDINSNVDPYKYIKSELANNCDFVVINLETALATPGVGAKNTVKNYTFLAPLKALDWMQGTNVTVVSLANNHAVDYGRTALLDGMRLLQEREILAFGAGANIDEAFSPKYYVFRDTTFGFVGVNAIENGATNPSYNSPGNAYFDYDRIVKEIKTAKQFANVVVVFPHWGTEGLNFADSFQRNWANIFVDAGADLVVGSGPHRVQEYVEISGKPVFYSLGNFATHGFYYTPGGSAGAYAKVVVQDQQIKSTSLSPVLISLYGLPFKPGEVPAEPYPGDGFGPL